MDQNLPAASPYLPPAARLDEDEAALPGWRGLGVSSQLAILVNGAEIMLWLALCVFFSIVSGPRVLPLAVVVAGCLSIAPACGIAGLWRGRRHIWLRVVSAVLNAILLCALGYVIYESVSDDPVHGVDFWVLCGATLPPATILAAHLAAFGYRGASH